ncbi:hypothetical protein BJX96DRAFT_161235 [Aspergillus floccosus]
MKESPTIPEQVNHASEQVNTVSEQVSNDSSSQSQSSSFLYTCCHAIHSFSQRTVDRHIIIYPTLWLVTFFYSYQPCALFFSHRTCLTFSEVMPVSFLVFTTLVIASRDYLRRQASAAESKRNSTSPPASAV